LTFAAAAVLAGTLIAQDPLEFEAASVKLSEHSEPVRGVGPKGQTTLSSYSGCSGGPGTTDPGRYTCTNTNLRHLIEDAWSLRTFQLTGPPTLDSATYDIEAKVTAQTTQDQFKQMLRKLVTDRFHLEIHREIRDQAGYVLSIGKDGHKLQVPPPGDTESPREALTNNPNGDGKAKTSGTGDLPPEEASLLAELRSRLAQTRAAAGRATRAGDAPPTHIASSSVNGAAKMAGRRATMADLVGALSRYFNCPVLDHTGLAGEWNFLVEYASEGGRGGSPAAEAMAMRQAMGATPAPAPSTEPSALPSIFSAFQKQLGLKLDAAKVPGDVWVVDKVDKIPVAN
jgi:uncharacterized protein (TIGR03435 family)